MGRVSGPRRGRRPGRRRPGDVLKKVFGLKKLQALQLNLPRAPAPSHPFSLETSLRANPEPLPAGPRKNWARGDAVDVEPRQNGRAERERGSRAAPAPGASPGTLRETREAPPMASTAVTGTPRARARGRPSIPLGAPPGGPRLRAAPSAGLGAPRRGRRRDRSTPEHVADGDGFGRPARSRSSSAIGSGARRAVFGGAGHDRAAVPGDGAAMPRRPRPVAGGADRSRPARRSAAKTTRRRRVGRRARAAVGAAPPCARLEMRLASPRVDSLSRGPREGARPRETKPGSPRRPSDPLRQQVTRR